MASDDFKLKVVIAADGDLAEREFKRLEKRGKKTAKNLSRAFASFAGNLASDAVQRLSAALKDGAVAVFNYSSALEQTEVGFTALLGNAEEAKKFLADLESFAVDTPFDFPTFANMAQRLKAAGVQTNKLMGIMKDFGNIAAATGDITAERLEGIGVALSQVISKGKVSAEEVEQLAERGVPAWKLLSEATGIAIRQLRKLSEQGVVTADVLVEAFQKISQERFGDAMERQANTFGGALNIIKNVFLIESKNATKPFYEEFRQLAVRTAKIVKSQKGDWVGMGKTIGDAFAEGFARATRNIVESYWERLQRESKRSNARQKVLLEQGQYWRVFTEQLHDMSSRMLGFGTRAAIDGTTNAFKEQGAAVKESGQRILDYSRNSVTPAIDALKKLSGAITEVSKEVKKQRSINESLKQQYMLLGRETVEAQTRQRLWLSGMRDFNSELAKAALHFARQIDLFKAQKKALDEYNQRLKTAQKHMSGLRDKAEFEIRIADPTPLQEFGQWVDKNALGLRGLQDEINKTAKLVFDAMVTKELRAIQKVTDAATKSLADFLRIEPLEEFDQKMDAVVRNYLSGFAKIQARDYYTGAITALTSEQALAIIRKELAGVTDADSAENARLRLQELETKTKSGGIAALVTAKAFGLLSASAKKLGKDITDANVATALKGVKAQLESLGIIKTTELEKVLASFTNPNIARAIEKQAVAMKITTEALKELMKAYADAQDKGIDVGRAGGEPEVGDDPTAAGAFGQGAAGVLTGEMESLYGAVFNVDSVMQKMGQTAAEAFMAMGAGVGQMVGDWVLLGNQADVSFKKVVASVLSGLAAQATQLAIFHTAMGFAALTPWGAFLYGPAAMQFKAAALWGIVAAGAAGAGRAFAGNSFQSQGAAGGAGGGGQNLENPTPIQSNFPNDQLATAINNLESRISGMSPGDVLTAGVKQTRNFVGDRVVADLSKNSTLTTQVARLVNRT